MIERKVHFSGKLNQTDPQLVVWVLPVWLLAFAGFVGGQLGWINPWVSLASFILWAALTGMGLMWPKYSDWRNYRLAQKMQADPARYMPLTPELFPNFDGLSAVMAAHDEKSGTIHSIHVGFNHTREKVYDFIEFDNEQDRVMFIMAKP